MKKILVLLGIILLTGARANANCEYKCVSPYDKSSAFSAFFSKITGLNKATEKTAEIALKKAIAKKFNAKDLDVDINSFSAKDMKKGIFKSAHVKGENVTLDKIYFSSVDLKTLCNFNYVQYEDKDVLFKEDLPLAFELKMSSDDLNKTMTTDNYKAVVDKLNKYCDKVPGLEITSTKVSIKSGKIVYTLGYKLPLIKKEQHIDVSSDLYIKDGKIKLKNHKLLTNLLKIDANKLISMLTPLNPLDFSVNILKDKKAHINVDDVQIKGNMVNISGIAIVPKD